MSDDTPVTAAQGTTSAGDNPGHTCIHCGSSDLVYHDEKQGFGGGKALVGAVAFGPLGLLAGTINKNKMHVHVRCNHCLHTFTAAEIFKHREKAAKRLAFEQRMANRTPLQKASDAVGVGCVLVLLFGVGMCICVPRSPPAAPPSASTLTAVPVETTTAPHRKSAKSPARPVKATRQKTEDHP